jgi:hypothetical protein
MEEGPVWDRKPYGVTRWGEAGDEGMDMLTAAIFVCQRSCGLSGLPVTLASLSLAFSLCVGVWVWVWVGACVPQSSVFLRAQPPSL